MLQLVKEYGPDSKYKANFGDDNKYMLAFTELVEARKPLLPFEQKDRAEEEGGSSKSSRNFPLYIPAEKLQGPQHKGYLPLCTYGGVHFKVVPPSHAPGVEYSLNAMRRLLKGRHFMYPIKYLKIIGKSGEGRGRESFFEAATEFGAKNLDTIERALCTRIDEDDYSVMVVLSMVFGIKVLYPEHIMAETHEGTKEVNLLGFSCDEAMLTHLFQYKPSAASQVGEDLNVLYMMPQMDTPVAQRVSVVLSKPGLALRLASAWMREMSMQNKRFAGLKSAGFSPADLAMLTLPITLPTHAGAQVEHMMTKISNTLLDASLAHRELTHSDLLAITESALAEKYAELRIRFSKSRSKNYMDHFHELHTEHSAALKGDAQIKHTFTMDVEHMTAEMLNTLDFRTMPDAPQDQAIYSAIFDNVSFLPSLHLRNISEAQLRLLFNKLLNWNKQAYLQQVALRPVKPASRRDDNKIHPAVRTAVKSITICGLESTAAKQLSTTEVVQAIAHELGIRVVFDTGARNK
jgi:hypothetical protein